MISFASRFMVILALLCDGRALTGQTEIPVEKARVEEARPLADVPEIQTAADKDVPPPITAQMRGRLQIDSVVASQSVTSQASLGDLQNGYGFRRLRLGADGKISDVGLYVAEIEFAGGSVRLADAFIGVTAVPWVSQVRIGYFREPFSLEGATSANHITFLERSPLNELDPARNVGVAGNWWPENERINFAVGGFRTDTNRGGISSGDEGAWSVTTRLTGLPVYEPEGERFRLVHLGGAFSQRSPANGTVNYGTNPQSSLLTVPDNAPSPFLLPISVPSDSQQLYNFQAAWVEGPFSLQGEWFGTTIQQRGGGLVFLNGYYASASWFVTGEHRGYDTQRAAFGGVSVLRPVTRTGKTVSGSGAVELTARFAFADFQSPELPPSANGKPVGTVLYSSTLGINWYLTDRLRLMGNYVVAIPELSGFPRVPVHEFSLRAAVFF